jgi:16S rRNA (adenine1518-N6/adenine1519-N6)-dimethyltransferase
VEQHLTLSRGRIHELLDQSGLAPRRDLGQNFVADANTVRRVASLARVGPGDRVLEIGAGLGSLTLALADTGAVVTALEVDPGIVAVLRDIVADRANVNVVEMDAMRADWESLLDAGERWTLVANLPYNVATPLVCDLLDGVPAIHRMLVMVQREVGERLVAAPGDEQFGAASLRVAYRASASLVRRVPATVFWPRPNVDSVVVRLDRLPMPPVGVDERSLWRVVDGAFAERRKTMRNALRRLGLEGEEADAVLTSAGVAPNARPEELDLPAFAAIADRMPE